MPLNRVLATAGLAALLIGAGKPEPAEAILAAEPSKALSPPEVVRAQLRALAHNARLGQDRGIAVTWRFASPANRAMTGPLPRFRSMIHAGYGAMLDHRRASLGPLEITAVEAKQVVMLEAADGSPHAYLWVLGLQEEGPLRGCWLTEAVFELDLRDPPPASPPSTDPSTV